MAPPRFDARVSETLVNRGGGPMMVMGVRLFFITVAVLAIAALVFLLATA